METVIYFLLRQGRGGIADFIEIAMGKLIGQFLQAVTQLEWLIRY
ncbi:hypothetical protein [Halobacillus karajensis]|nr:hypothetical protein [Halobacillus karajensis]